MFRIRKLKRELWRLEKNIYRFQYWTEKIFSIGLDIYMVYEVGSDCL